jgi:hypothetical protein
MLATTLRTCFGVYGDYSGVIGQHAVPVTRCRSGLLQTALQAGHNDASGVGVHDTNARRPTVDGRMRAEASRIDLVGRAVEHFACRLTFTRLLAVTSE